MASVVQMYNLPPFFCVQPVPGTLQQQLKLWGQLLMLHVVASSAVARDGIAPFCKLYTPSSPIFFNRTLNRRLSREGASLVLHQLQEDYGQHCLPFCAEEICGSGTSTETPAILVFAQRVQDIFDSCILGYLEDNGHVLPGASVGAASAAVLTVSELVEDNVFAQWSSKGATNCGFADLDVEHAAQQLDPTTSAVDIATVLRAILHSYHSGQRSASTGLRVLLFNHDGSETRPYQGVKFCNA